MPARTIAIIGASSDRKKFGNKAVRAYLSRGWTVYPVNPTRTEIEGLACYGSILQVPRPLDRASIYLPSTTGMSILNELATVHPAEVYLNPGSESPELIARATALGINTILDCSIVAIGLKPGQFPA